MGLTLALNACEGHLQIALGRGEEALCLQDWAAPSRGAEILAPAVAEMCARLNAAPARISRVACARGPGSFTGIRLILTFAAAFKRVNKAELAGLDYMALLAAGAADLLAPGDELLVLTHARRDLLHCRVFNHAAEALSDIELISPAEAARRALKPTGGGDICLMGSAVARQRDFFAASCPAARLLPERLNNPRPEDLLVLANKAAFGPADIEPLYIRPCDAVENLESISARAGRDPGRDMAELQRLLTERAQTP